MSQPPRHPPATPPQETGSATAGLDLQPHPGLPPPRALHIVSPDARIGLDKGALRIERPDAAPVVVRISQLQALALHGPASITTPCIHALLRAGVPLTWRSLSGHYVGQAVNLSAGSARARKAQYAAQQGPLGHALATRLVVAKITNMRALLRRRQGPGGEALAAAIRSLDRHAAEAIRSNSADALRGHEGAATAAYLRCWPALITADDRAWSFTARLRRPPRGGVNALLSYGAAVLAGECAAAALAAGLDVTEGFLHASRAGRPALALDLMEPFRPGIVDSVALALLNTRAIKPADLEAGAEEDGSRFTDEGRRTILLALERRFCAAAPGGAGDWRAAIGTAARTLVAALADGDAGRLLLPEQR